MKTGEIERAGHGDLGEDFDVNKVPPCETPAWPLKSLSWPYWPYPLRAAPRGAVLKSGTRAAADSSSKSCGWGLLLRRNRPVDLKVGLCTGGWVSALPTTVIVFVINVKWFTEE